MTKVAFTAKRVQTFKCPPDKKQVIYMDKDCPNLGLRVTPAGKPAFVFQGYLQRRCIRITIGSPDTWAIPDAQKAAREYQRLLDRGIDPREQKREQEQLARIEASKGSFDDLLLAYIDERSRAGMAQNSLRDVRNMKRNDCDSHPQLMALRACDVTPAHINMILTPILQREKYRQADKVRSYLHAAFAFGMKHDNIAGTATTSQTFSITHNPVTATSFEAAHKNLARQAVSRALNNAELAQFYKTCDAPDSGISWAMAQLFKMVIATAGQRIDQLCRLPWPDVQGDYIHIIDSKGRGNIARAHFVPHTPRTQAILAELEQVTGQHSHPFSSRVDKPFDVASYSRAVKRWLKTDYAVIDGERIPDFTPRDLRRTMTQLMKREGVPDSASNEIQSHGLTGVVERHYNNDPAASLPSKQRTIKQVERILCRVLGEAPADNVILLQRKDA